MDQATISEISTLGNLLIVFLRMHLPILIIIGGLLVLIDIYHRRWYDDEFVKRDFNLQFPNIKKAQLDLENTFLITALCTTLIIPTTALLLKYFVFDTSFQLSLAVMYILLVVGLYFATRRKIKHLNRLRGSIDHALDYNSILVSEPDAFDYYNT